MNNVKCTMLPPHDWDPHAADAHPTACQLLRGCMEQQPLHHAAGGKQLVLQCLEEGYSTSIQAAHQAFKGWSGAVLVAQLSYNGPWIAIERLPGSPTPYPEQELEINDNPQWTENSAVLQPMVLIRNVFKCIYVFSQGAGGIGRDRTSHSRHMFSLFAALFSPFPQRKDQKGFLLL